MTHRIRIAATTVLATVATSALLLNAQRQSARHDHPAGAAHADGTVDVLVDLRDNATDADRVSMEGSLGAQLVPNSVVSRSNRLFRTTLPGTMADQMVARLRQNPLVEAAELEHQLSLGPMSSLARPVDHSPVLQRSFVSSTRPDDPRYAEQWNFQMVNAEKAWERTRGKGVVVAVIDTGVSGVASRKGAACRDFNTTQFVAGYDFVNDDNEPYDDHAHGTHVAGTIAESTNNGEGVAGLAHEATIMPLKVLSASGSGGSADIADAIRWAADKGAHVINMSLGSAFPDSVIHNACKYARKKGVVLICAAGNSGRQGVGYPAAFAECFAVSAVGPSGNLAEYSSWGKQVALAAPGGDYVSSGNRADGILQNTNLGPALGGHGDDYYAFQGTSMATPHVAAVAAMVISTGVKDAAKVEEILRKSAAPKGDAKKFGAGLLDAAKAVELGAAVAAGDPAVLEAGPMGQSDADPAQAEVQTVLDCPLSAETATDSASSARAWAAVLLPLAGLLGLVGIGSRGGGRSTVAGLRAGSLAAGASLVFAGCVASGVSPLLAAVVSSVLLPGLLAAWLWNHRSVGLVSTWAVGQLSALALALHNGLAPLGAATQTPAGRSWAMLQLAALAVVAVGSALRSRGVASSGSDSAR
jgi:subtilisin family serine protease